MAEPICEFLGLKELLSQKGYNIGKAEAWRSIQGEDISLREGNMEFGDNGIFFIDDNGNRHQVFLYKRRYRLVTYGKPRYHICRCETIRTFLRGNDIPEYRRANTSSVKVLNWDNDDMEEEVDKLPLCKYCARKIHEMDENIDSAEFAEILRNAAEVEDEPQNLEINPRTGYTNDWHEISSRIREERNYTCEKCGVRVSPLESEFLHVHHKNLRKTDNRPQNLQCLCIKCHSEVDATHVRNFANRSQQLLIRLFKDAYGNNQY